jgi:uncharacterized protein YndB with AHSA1/START domain
MNPIDADDAIIKEIVIKAPAERIFEALVDPRQRVKWWGAEGRFQTTHMESNLRPGGAWLMRGIGADGRHFTVRGEYRAIERPRLLEFTWLPDWQEDAPLTLVRFDLEEKDGSTTVRLTHSAHTTERSRESHRSWQRILARLQGYVEEKVLN